VRIEREDGEGVALAEGGLLDGERAQVERLGPVVRPLEGVEACEVAERGGDQEVLAEGLLADEVCLRLRQPRSWLLLVGFPSCRTAKEHHHHQSENPTHLFSPSSKDSHLEPVRRYQ